MEDATDTPDMNTVVIREGCTYDAEALAAAVEPLLPGGTCRRICIKPNWVLHAESDEFPIEALVTSPALIEAVIEACLRRYPDAESIIVGDVPLQSCEWEKLRGQAGISRLEEKYAGHTRPTVSFHDLRRERVRRIDGYLEKDPEPDGDPVGYREVILDDASYLDEISTGRPNFRVSDYNPQLTTSSHRKGSHRYLIAGSALACDLFINLPKMKTHQKAGITGALKNLVGINGQKAYLVHHRKGSAARGGDEFSPITPFAIRLQTRMRDLLQGRSRVLFNAARRVWLLMKRMLGIRTEGTRENMRRGGVYIAAGSWYGNDTIWRMIYDLNMIIRYAPPEGGRLCAEPQRRCIAIVDGILSGEGNGPLQPLPVESGIILAGRDPFAVDAVMARLMGYDPERIPSLNRRRRFRDDEWGQFTLESLRVEKDGGMLTGLHAVAPVQTYLPPPGWKGHIEDA